MAYIEFHRINKLYEGGVHAIQDVSFDIEQGQFTVLVGPSGCGKSTLLRMLAGLEEVSTGTIVLNNEIINEKHPKDRNISMVFQNYALYPHLTVYDNIAFGLKLKKIPQEIKDEQGKVIKTKMVGIPREEIDQKVREVAEKLELTEYLSRKPKQLSGGQKQRVALARALVRNNDVFLLDEPLSNLDAKLRVEMRKTIKALHQDVKKPFIYVTHDQVEAMTMADRIVVLKLGEIQQIGSPKEIYDEPANLFVATFFGSPSMSIIDGTLKENNGQIYVELLNKQALYIPEDMKTQFLDYSMINKPVKVGFRPTSYRVSEPANISHYSKISGEIYYKELFGSETLVKVKLSENQSIDVFIPNEYPSKIGDTISLYAHTFKMKVFDPVSQKSVFGISHELTFKNVPYKVEDNEIKFELGQAQHYPLESRIINYGLINACKECSVSFGTEHIKLIDKGNCLSFTGKILSIKNLFERVAVFMELKGRKEPLVFFTKKDTTLKVGETTTVYINKDHVKFHSEEGAPLLSKYDIDNYVTNPEDLAILNAKLKLTGDSLNVPFDLTGINHKKGNLKVILLDEEKYLDKTLIYYRVKGMKGYLSALIDGSIDMVKTPTLKLNISINEK